MIRRPLLALAAGLAVPLLAAANAAATPERDKELLAIAASCAAFHQAALDQMDLPVEPHETNRQAFIRVIDALSARHLPQAHREPWFVEHVVDRTAIVGNIIELKPEEAGPKVRENLGACVALLPEMNAAAGLE